MRCLVVIIVDPAFVALLAFSTLHVVRHRVEAPLKEVAVEPRDTHGWGKVIRKGIVHS